MVNWRVLGAIAGVELAIVALGVVLIAPHAATAHAVDGCQVDHVAESGEHGNATVLVCEEQPTVDDRKRAGSWNGSAVKLSGYARLADLYVHELGHATGFAHSESGIMTPRVVPSPDCSISQTEREIAAAWDTVDVTTGQCKRLQTPYGAVY